MRSSLLFSSPVLSLVAWLVVPANSGWARPAGPTEPLTLTNPLASPDTCRDCHEFPTAPHMAGERRYDPYSWLPSMMSNASRDPVFWAGVAVAAQDVPGATSICVRCHSPRGFLAGQGDATTMEALDAEYRDGISCEFCHRMVEDDTVPPGNGQYVLDDGDGGILAMRGPWTYGDEGLVPPHETVQSTFIGDSRMCGTCHDVTTERERVDDSGSGMGMHFNEQRTYSEWLNSAYAVAGDDFASCQECHMPAVDDVAGCRLFSEIGQRHETGARRHELLGANRFMLTVLKSLYGWEGDESIPDEMFDTAVERTDEFLLTAARMEVMTPASVDLEQGLSGLGVTVENLTGHKLPTGYSEGRVMWIEVVASYDGAVVYSSGRWDPDEPAYVDGIEDDPQIRRYEGLAEDADDGTRLHLLRNNRWIEDNRLPPKGLTADIETDPVGDRYQLAGGKWPHIDTTNYAFKPADVTDVTPEDASDDRLEISVRLLYLINTRTYVEFLRDENQSNASGDAVFDLFEEHGGAEPVVIAESTTLVPLTGLQGAGDDDDSGTGDTGTGDTGESGTSDTGDSAGQSSGGSQTGDTGQSSGATTGPSGTGEDSGSSTSSEPVDDGCSCREVPATNAAWWSVAGGVAAGWGRRRRRR